MSQYIRKMNSGGPVESQEQERNRMNVFETASGEYDAKALAANFENNIDDYVNYIGIQKDSKDYQRFIDQAARIQKGIVDGTFKRVEGLKYEGSIISDGNKFQRLALGLLDKVISASNKKTNDNADLALEQYDPAGLRKFFYNYQFGGQETPEFNSWADLDPKKQDGTRSNTNRAQRFAEVIDKYADSLTDSNIDWSKSPYKTKDEYISRLRTAASSLRSNGLDVNSKMYLNKIGIGDKRQDELFGSNSVQVRKSDTQTNDSQATPRAHAAQLEILKRNLDADFKNGVITQEEYDEAIARFNGEYKKRVYGIGTGNNNTQSEGSSSFSGLTQDQRYQQYANTNWKKNINKSSVDLYGLQFNNEDDDPGTEKYKSWLYNKKQDAVKYQASLIRSIYTGAYDPKNNKKAVDSSGLTNQQIIYNFFLGQRENQKLLSYASDGKRQFYLRNSLNLRDGTIIRWNLDTNQFQRVYIQPNSDSYISRLFHEKFNEKYPETTNGSTSPSDVQWSKYGSKLRELRSLRKFQSGGEADNDSSTVDNGLDLGDLDAELNEAGSLYLEEVQDETQQMKTDSIKQEAANKHVDPEIITKQQTKVSDLDDDVSFQIAKWLRNAGTAAAAGGLACMFVPEPTVSKGASVILFGASAIADLGAEAIDYFDGRTSGSEALTNAIVTAVTTLGPLKLAKQVQKGSALASKALKWTMAGMTGVGAYSTLATSENAKNPFDDDLTVQELKDRQRWWSGMFGTLSGISGTSALFVDPVHGGAFRNNVLGALSDPVTYALNWKNMPGNNPQWRYIHINQDTYNPNGTLKIRGKNPDQFVTITNAEAQRIKDAAVSQVRQSNGAVSAENLNKGATDVLNASRPRPKVAPEDVKAILASEQDNGDLKLFLPGDDGKNIEITVPKAQVEQIRNTYNGKYNSLIGEGTPSDKAKLNAEHEALNAASEQLQSHINKSAHNEISPFSVSIGKRKWIPDWVSSVEGRVNEAFDNAIVARGETSSSNSAFDPKTTAGRQNIENASQLVHDKNGEIRQWLTEQYINKLTGERTKWRSIPHDREGRETRILGPANREQVIRSEQQRGNLDSNGQLTDEAIQNLFKDMTLSDMNNAITAKKYFSGESYENKSPGDIFQAIRDDGFTGKFEPGAVEKFYINKILNDPKYNDFQNALYDVKNADGTEIDYAHLRHQLLKLFDEYKKYGINSMINLRDSYLHDVGYDPVPKGSSTPTSGGTQDSGTAPASEANPAPEGGTTAAPEGGTTQVNTEAGATNDGSSLPPPSGDPDLLAKMDLTSEQGKAFDILRRNFPDISREKIHRYVTQNINDTRQLDALSHKRWNSKRKREFVRAYLKHNGGVLRSLRFLRGGIILAEGGTDTSKWDWYLNRFTQKEMLGTENAKRNQLAGASIATNDHNKAFDLSLAAQKNQAYIDNPLVVGQDIQNFYNNHGQSMGAEDFVNYYNSEMQKLRDTWGVAADGTLSMTNWKLNTPHGMRDHNRLFRELYASRSTQADGPEYNIGYQEKGAHGEDIEDMVGSSSWMRRPDFYRVKFEQDTDEGKKSRIHDVTLSDGKKVKVYKKDNGDIAILPASEQPASEQPEMKEEPAQAAETVDRRYINDGSVIGTTSGLNQYKRPKDKIKDLFDDAGNLLAGRKADMLAVGRLLNALRTNRKVFNEMMKIRPALREPLVGHRYVRGDWSTMENIYNQASRNQNIAGNPASSDANVNNANRLQAARDAGDMKAKADLQYANEIRKTSEKQLDLDEDVYRNNVTTQNLNSASLTEHGNYKHQLRAGLYSTNYTNIDTALKEREKRIREKDTEEKVKREEAIEAYKNIRKLKALASDPIYIQLKAQFSKATPGSIEWTSAYNAINNYKTQFLNDYSEAANLQELKKYGINPDDYKVENTQSTTNGFTPQIVASKSGGTIDNSKIKRRKDDNQLFVKQILEAIKTNEKALDRLSRSQLLSIRKILS